MNIAIIAAAGRGTRMGGEQAKQFRQLGGIPIIIHTLRRFEECKAIDAAIVVVPESDVADFKKLLDQYNLKKVSSVVRGGQSRTETVWRGLQAIRPEGANIVAVHDGVRPFVRPEQIERTVQAAHETGAAILAVPATDTIKEVKDGRITRTLNRATLWHAQTPQCFRYDLLVQAYNQAITENLEVTDDSALVEGLGISVTVIEGDRLNIKITRPEDIALAEILIKGSQESGVRSQK